MTAVTRISAGGLVLAQFAILSSAGYPYSTTGVLSNGSAGGMGILKGVKRAAPTQPEPRRENATGEDGRYRQTFTFLPAELAELDMLLAARSMDDDAHLRGLKKFTETIINGVLIDANAAADAVQACLILNTVAKSADTSTFGLARYRNRIYPIGNVIYIGEEFEEVTIAGFTYKIHLTQASKFPWGESFAAATHGATRAAGIDYYSTYPLTLHTKIGNNTDTTITLDYTPAGNQTDGYVKVWVNGVTTTAYTVSTSAKTVVFTTAPTTATVVVVRYESTDILASN